MTANHQIVYSIDAELLLISGIFPQFAPIVLFRYIQVAAYLGVAGPAYQAVFNVAPRTSREQIRLFVDGVLIQVGMLIAGVVLIALRAAPGLRLHLAVGFVLAAIATVFAFVARARYGGAVLAALRDGVGTLFDHPTSAPSTPDNRAAKVAIEALQAKDPATRRAAAATMASIRASEAVDCIVKSLDDSDAEVRRLCLDAIAIHQLTEATLEVHRMLADEDARVRRAAVITIGALAKYPRGMVRALEPMLADLDPSIGATAAGCILSAGEEGAGREFVTAFLHSGEAKKIIIALEAFKRAPGAMPVTTIVKFLSSADPLIRTAAVNAVAELDPPQPSPRTLIGLLTDRDATVAAATRKAVIRNGDTLEPVIMQELRMPGPDGPRIEDAMLDVLSEILPIRDPAELIDFGDYCSRRMEQFLGYRTVALNSALDLPLLLEALIDRAKREARLVLLSYTVARGSYDHFVFEGLSSDDTEQRSYSLEAFETMPESAATRSALRMFDSNLLDPAHKEPTHESFADVVTALIESGNAWTKACVITEAKSMIDPRLITRCEDDPNPIVRDSAFRSREGNISMLVKDTVSLVERVIFLRKTPVFSKLSPTMLESVAVACEEQTFRRGEVLDEEGRMADCMYIIVEGSVRILAGSEREQIAIRTAGDVIGEMSIIGHRPRAATMVASVITRSLVLSHRAFEQVLHRSPEVSLAVMEVLCDRLIEAEHRTEP